MIIFENLNEASKKIRSIKNKGKKIGLCHGVFDLLHLGHLEHFQEAKKKCNFLVVSITADKYVNKGLGVPYFNEKDRISALSYINCIDGLLINNSFTSINLIKTIKPDIYFKGIDYKNFKNDKTGNIIEEKNAITSVEGKLITTSTKKESSTYLLNRYSSKNNKHQKIINKVLKQYKNFSNIRKKINLLSSKKILIIGEIILDEYIYVDALGKAGKDPILTFNINNKKILPGGTLAIANHISDFCKKIDILSYIGDNEKNDKFLQHYIKKNISIKSFQKNDSPTIIKTRYIDNETNSKLIGVYKINDEIINFNIEKKILNFLNKNIEKYDNVIVADYGHGLISKKMIQLIQKKSKYLSVNVQLNSSNFGFHTVSKYSKANLFCLHEGELRQDLRTKTKELPSLIKELSKKIVFKRIFITRGKKGSISYIRSKFIECPAFDSPITDKVGAGDSFFSISSICSSINLTEELTMIIGNIFGVLSIQNNGNSKNFSKNEILKILESLFIK